MYLSIANHLRAIPSPAQHLATLLQHLTRNHHKMRAFSFLYLLQALLFNTFPPTSVEKICRQAAASNPNVNYDFCVTSLQSDPESSSADIQQLAIIATRLSIANATSTMSKIAELLQEQDSGSYVKMCLEDCLGMYSDAIDNLGVAADDIQVMEIDGAVRLLGAVVDAGRLRSWVRRGRGAIAFDNGECESRGIVDYCSQHHCLS